MTTSATTTPESVAQAAIDEGKKLYVEKNYSKSIQLLEQGLTVIPTDTQARSAVIQYYTSMGYTVKALRHLLFMLKDHPDNLNLLTRTATLYLAREEYIKGLHYVMKALAIKPTEFNLYWVAFTTMLKMDKKQEAFMFARQTQKRFNDNPLTLLMLAKAASETGHGKTALSYLDLVAVDIVPKEYRYIIHEERARALEQLGQYDAAFNGFVEANNTLLTDSNIEGLDIDTPLNRIESCEQWFSNHHTIGSWGLPIDDGIAAPIFVVGFHGSGSHLLRALFKDPKEFALLEEGSALDYLLRFHSAKLGHPLQEPHFMENMTMQDILDVRRQFQQFLQQDVFARKLENIPFVDTSPFNLMRLGLINRIYPEAKIIMMIRDPRDVVINCLRHIARPDNITVRFNLIENITHLYEKLMSLYRSYDQHLPIGIMEIRYEDLRDHPTETIKPLLHFIGKDYKPTITIPADTTYNASWQPYAKQLENAQEALSPFIEELGYEA